MSRQAIASLAVIGCLGVAMMFPGAGFAQDMRTLEIRDGVVRIDGKQIPQDRLPEHLQTNDVDVHFSWSGINEPVIEIGGRFYVVDAESIKETDADASATDARRKYFEALGAVGEGTWYSVGADDPATRKQVEALYMQAREMDEISEELARQRSRDSERLAREIREQAMATKRMAAEIPRMNVATYWDAVRENDQVLYNSLVDEWNLESRIQALAVRIRSMAYGGQRDGAVNELRQLLNKAFEVKQENRRREINQLEKELQNLQGRLGKRESHRDEIIEKRLRELVGR